jgi:hypothetical protein
MKKESKMKWYLKVLRKYADFGGRAKRISIKRYVPDLRQKTHLIHQESLEQD